MEDDVYIYAYYPIKVEKNDDGLWSWKYVGCETKQVSEILSVSKIITFEELYNTVKDELEIDTTSYDFEMKVMVPGSKGRPLVLNCDRVVHRFLSICNLKEDFILICLKEKEKDIDIEMETRHVEEMYESHESRENYKVANGTETRETCVEIDDNEEINVDVVENGREEMLDGIRERIETCVEDSYLNSGSDNMEVNGLFDESDPLLGECVFLENGDVNTRESPNVVVPSNVVVPPRVVRVNVERMRVCSSVVVCIPESEDFHVNETFKLISDLVYKLQKLATKYKFEYKGQATNKTILSVVCKGEGCKWRLRGTAIDKRPVGSEAKYKPRFMVVKYKEKHSCHPIAPKKDHRHNSHKLVGRHYARRFKDAIRVNRPRDFMSDYHEKTGYEINYAKANRAKRYAESLIRGDPTESFGELPKYFHRLKLRNPGTVTHIKTVGDDIFKYSFMALGQSMNGFFSAIRKVISVDGTHLKSHYKGVLLVAVCQDGNHQLFPLAFGVVDREKTEAWTWFFEKLKDIIGDESDISILSDGADSISAAFTAVFKNAHHGRCMYHMQKNVRKRYPKRNAGMLFMLSAEAYTKAEFKVHFERMRQKGGCEDVDAYLKEDSFHLWSRAYFTGLRYNMMTTNDAESLNGKLKRAREFSIVGLMEYIRETLQLWFAKRSKNANNCCTSLTPEIEKEMKIRLERVSRYKVFPISEVKYDVHDMDNVDFYVVDMEASQCDCRKFQLDRIPCDHAIAVVKHVGNKELYEYCDWYYGTACWRLAYSHPVYPLPNEDECEYPDDVLNHKVLPPPEPTRQSGRPPKKRITSAGDSKRKVHCTKCNGTGHYKSTCTRLAILP